MSFDEQDYRMVHDVIHGSFYLHELLWYIIDTEEFQRLRNIKQTANTVYVYNGADHTRFAHCIGVSHLCGVFVDNLKLRLKSHERELTDELLGDKMRLCIQIAGLCHDIGHCAFSHLYDGKVVPYFDPDAKFSHEQASYLILKRLYKQMEKQFNRFSIEESDIEFIGKLILGCPDNVPEDDPVLSELKWKEKDHKYQYIYQILSNEQDNEYVGIDVDKFDYIKRDCHYTNIPTGFDPQRLIKFAYIDTSDPSNYRLKYNSKAKELIRQMWIARGELHRRVYQHRVVKCYDLMILEVLKLVGTHFKVIYYDHEGNRQSELLCNIHKNMPAYLHITDHILTLISATESSVPEVLEAQSILRAINRREKWKTLVSITTTDKITLELPTEKLCFSESKVKYDSYTEYYYHVFCKKNLNMVEHAELMKCIKKMDQDKVKTIHIRMKNLI